MPLPPPMVERQRRSTPKWGHQPFTGLQGQGGGGRKQHELRKTSVRVGRRMSSA
jgi:hypothetical protein